MMLVMAAGGDAVECAEQAAAFAEIGASLLFGSRVDAARRLGGLVAAADSGRLALCGFGVSPQIGSGAQAADAALLARLLLPDEAAAPAADDRSD
jgi:flagellar biosynthesis protein FlhF